MKRGERVCFISGKFNVVHPGHLRLFRHAKEITDYLIVGVFGDDYLLAGDILVPENDRLEGVRANIWVDETILITDVANTILDIKPDIVLMGKEHEGASNLEQSVVAKYGGALRFAGGDTRISTSTLMQAEREFERASLSRARDFLSRHNISQTGLGTLIDSLANVRTLVVGDLIVDRYVDCQPLGLSAEDPTVVVSPVAKQEFVGGAGIVAAHAAQLGAEATLVAVRGGDDVGESAITQLEKLSVNTSILVDHDRPTTRKTRYRASGKTLLRVNELRDHQIDERIAEKLLRAVKERLSEYDVLIFADFSYGVLGDELVSAILREVKGKRLITAADSQSSSQMGDIARFKNVTLLTPTEHEARLAVRDSGSGLIGISEKLRQVTSASYIPITLAGEGVFLHRPESSQPEWTDDQVPALNANPVDVSGAGDAFLVSTALALATGADIWSSIFVGSLGSACQVERVGNIPITREELLRKLNS